ncbi:hypothetical protein Cyrtocomes_00528 [Candidatus Cyrtobacter comes]|uniref:Uncharacterized protein n=1 Tax=Candidatus Cyrtobacter comes TaxID=675776 RepID=A0ABU5L7Y6_9RICK|nr:hypothetical protein [Candidatus Cyrtobacter comes]
MMITELGSADELVMGSGDGKAENQYIQIRNY